MGFYVTRLMLLLVSWALLTGPVWAKKSRKKTRHKKRRHSRKIKPAPRPTPPVVTPTPPKPTPPKPTTKKAIKPPPKTESKTGGQMEYLGLRQIWSNAQSFLDLEDFDKAHSLLDSLQRQSLRLGVHNLFKMSIALVRISRRLAEKGRYKEAIRLCLAAQRLAPDLPHPHFQAAALYWGKSKLNVGKIIAEYARGVIKFWDHLPTRMRVMANVSGFGWLTILLAALLFALVGVFANHGFLAHDISRLIRGTLPMAQLRVMVLLLLALPIALGMGLLFSLTIWVVFVSFYLRRNSLLVASVIMVFLLCTTFFSVYFVRITHYSVNPASELYNCNYGVCSGDDKKALKRLTTDQDALVTMAAVKQRRKKYKEAIKLLQLALKHGRPTPEILNNLGCLHQFLNKKKLGMGYFDQALKLDADFVPALYNKSLALFEEGENKAAKQHLLLAEERDNEWVQKYRKLQDHIEKQQIDGKAMPFRVSAPVSASRIVDRVLLKGHDGAEMLVPFPELLQGRLDSVTFLWVTLGALILVVLLLLFRNFIFVAEACQKCGKPASAREPHNQAPPSNDGDEVANAPQKPVICLRCAELRDGEHAAKETWIREKRIESRRLLGEKLKNYASFVMPGLGHMLFGQMIKGFIFASLFIFSIMNIIGWRGILRDTLQVSASMPLPRLLLFILILFTVYIVAILDTFLKSKGSSK